MKRLFGSISGLKAGHIHRLENLYRRRIPTEFVVTFEIAREISNLSHEIRRQIGLLVNRLGKIVSVIIGNYQEIVIPDISEYRASPGRLRGLRCIHTHLKNELLTKDDLTDLVLLRLDIIAAITITSSGQPSQVHVGHILPKSQTGKQCRILAPLNPGQLDIGCLELIKAVEIELARAGHLYKAGSGKERAILISVTTAPRRMAMDSLAELKELALSSGIDVVDTVLQQRKSVDSRFLIGLGKLQDIAILILKKGATLIVFDQELNPSQMRSISDKIDIKIIDRTQLILDIFAQRAQTREGKLQVELAQLKYLLPRLIEKSTAMSRLTGGIGGRGPGETKLEIHRRRVRDRITRLGKDLLFVKKQRKQQKAKRQKKGLPVISIIGYTNAGKSTLLNTLTKSDVCVEDRLFATLDPSSRRLKFPEDVEVIITDTVGFIKNLPRELMVAFRATFEELETADLLLHVIDISNPRFKDHIESVEKILCELNLNNIPLMRVLNKQDIVDREIINRHIKQLEGIAISANNESTLMPLLEKMQALIRA